MVRGIDTDMVFISRKSPGPRIFDVSYIPGFSSTENSLKKQFLDEVNLSAVKLLVPQKAQPSLQDTCYPMAGGKTISQLSVEVATRFNLCKCYCVQFEVDEIVLSPDTFLSFLYKEYPSADGFLDLTCKIVPVSSDAPPYAEYRKTCKSCSFDFDRTPKVPVATEAEEVFAEEIPFPPLCIRTRRQAKQASLLRNGGSYRSGMLVYGSYGDGELEF